MCYDKEQLRLTAENMTRRYRVTMSGDVAGEPICHAKAFAHPKFWVITADDPHILQQYEWGLIPAWAKDMKYADEIRKQTANARSETVFEKASFKDSIRRKRCIIPVHGFFEWFTLDAKRKFPFFIYMKDGDVFSMGGIYDHWTDRTTGEVHQTYSVVTTEANGLMASIHNTKMRMPLILPQEAELQWLDQSLSDEDIKSLMIPLDENLMAAHSITKRI